MKVIAFDLGDTLVEYEGVPLSWEAHYPEALGHLATTLNIPATPQKIEEASAVLRRYNTRLNPRTEEVKFATILGELLTCFEAKAAVEELAAATAFFGIFRQRLRCFPEVHAAITNLRARGLRIGVFTDVPYGMPRELVLGDVHDAALGGAFDELITSRDAGHRKPSPLTLRQLANVLSCAPGEMAYVGNEKKDVDAALAFGCEAILIDRAGHKPAWGQSRTITSLAEL